MSTILDKDGEMGRQAPRDTGCIAKGVCINLSVYLLRWRLVFIIDVSDILVALSTDEIVNWLASARLTAKC